MIKNILFLKTKILPIQQSLKHIYQHNNDKIFNYFITTNEIKNCIDFASNPDYNIFIAPELYQI